MRECIYCGRQLEAGENCSCAMSEARRRAKNAEQPQESTKEQKREEMKRKKQADKQEKKEHKARMRQARRTQRSFGKNADIGGAFHDFKRLLIAFIKSPVDTVMNPGEMSKMVVLLFVIIEGLFGGMCVYAITTGAARGPVGTLGAMMGLGGMDGYTLIKGWVLSAISGAICGIIVFFIYSGVFYIVNKFIFKQFTPYWEFVKRFAFVALPVTIIGTLGVILGFFSYRTFVILLICGLIGAILTTYEILRSVWYEKSATKIIYTMMICIFVIVTILINLIRFA